MNGLLFSQGRRSVTASPPPQTPTRSRANRLAHERPPVVVASLPFAAALACWESGELHVECNAAWSDIAVAPTTLHSMSALAEQFGVEGFASWIDLSADAQLATPFRAEFAAPESIRWMELKCYRLAETPAQAWLLTLADVTDRIERERSHREHETQLFYASKVMSVGEMAAVISHELNHPLATCINFLTGIQRKLDKGDDAMRSLVAPVQTATAQAERAVQIVARIREFVRAREPKRSPVDIATLFEAVERWIQRDSTAAQVSVRVSVAENLPVLYVDRVMIEQVMVNLAKNAIEALRALGAARNKSITLGAALADGDPSTAELWVADSGNGLSAAARSSLFTPFVSSKQQGMGIGLSICRSIVEFHRGRLWYEPNEGGGAKFIFTLPILAVDPVAEAPGEAAAEPSAATARST
jgi:signal transduction histidine kinase